MSIFKPGITFALAALCIAVAQAAGPNLGRPATPAEIAAIDIDVAPDGGGLPPGTGNTTTGEAVYQDKCAVCHGAAGQGKPADRLVGGVGSLASDKPVRTVASYWPYATTLFDYIRRAMPLNAPMSLTDDEVYAVTAYLLAQDGIVPKDSVLDAASLAKVRMPNRDGFVDRSQLRR
jgi:cytochrome c